MFFFKVQLMKKITEQHNRHKEEESRKSKEIAQLLKEQRRQKNAVQSLEAQVSAKDNILKRKTEEVIALRKSQRAKSEQRRRPPTYSQNTNFTSRSIRQSWEHLYHYILAAARNKQMITQLEKELDRLIAERETLSHELNNLDNELSSKSDELNESENLKTNIQYIQENIDHVQKAIMDFEDSKDTVKGDLSKIQSILDSFDSLADAKFILQKFSDSSILLSCNLAIAESQLQDHQSLLEEAQQESTVQQQILQHLLSQNSNVQISDMFESFKVMNTAHSEDHAEDSRSKNSSQKSLVSNATYDVPKEDRLLDCVELRGRSSRSPSPLGNFES